jgi:hypothetical protein
MIPWCLRSNLSANRPHKTPKNNANSSLLTWKSNFGQFKRGFANVAAHFDTFLAPSVRFLVVKNNLKVDELNGIGTGVKGRVLKGDVLKYLGNI